MNTRTLLAALAGAVASFLLGWLVFGMMMTPIYKVHTVVYAGLMKDSPNLIAIFIANCASSLLIAMICSWSKMVGLMKGAVIGATVGLLMAVNYDMFNVALMNMYTDHTIVIIDVLVSTAFSGVIGAIIGMIMGMGNKGEAAA